MFKLNRAMAALIAFGVLAGPVLAQDAKKKDSEQKKEVSSAFQVPEGASTEELGTFLKSLRSKRTRNRDEAKQRAMAVYQSSSAILKGMPSDELAVLAADARLSVLGAMKQIDEKIEETPAQFAKELAASSNPKLALIGKHFELNLTAGGMLKMKPAERAGFLEECFALAKTHGVDSKTFSLLNTRIGRTLEKSGRTKEAIKVYERLAPMMATSKNKRLAAYAEKLEGAVRRLKLMGNPIKLTGTTHTGDEFKWADYKGKVVLVDFWATWCGPCVRELPNMMKNYEDYHSKGFEIVGVNMDSNRGRFDKFVSDREVPWTHIMGTPEKFGWDQPIAAYYGVSSIPTQMLVGKDGKVIALNLRGRALDIRLEQIFGERPKSEEADGEDAAKK